MFKPEGPWYSPKCDNNYDPPRCSDYYHMQEQTPGYPSGDGNCAAPGCDCGEQPCGFYLWNHSSTTVVNGQTFQDWFINSYVYDALGSSDLVSGFFWDDVWPDSKNRNWRDAMPNVTEDTGLTDADLDQGHASWQKNMDELAKVTLAKGKFAWQLFWTGGEANGTGSCAPTTPVMQDTCADDLKALCLAGSPPQVRTMMYGFLKSPKSESKRVVNPPDLKEDLANFLLTRGKYAYLGHGWLGCSLEYVFPPELNLDYGEPTELCHETKPGVFQREWTKATIEMDCNSYTPTITMK